MKRGERLFMKLIVIHLIVLLTAQFLLTRQSIAPYMSKVVRYEGVTKQYVPRTIETAK